MASTTTTTPRLKKGFGAEFTSHDPPLGEVVHPTSLSNSIQYLVTSSSGARTVLYELNSPTAPVEFDRMLEPPNFPWLPSSSSSSSPFPRKGHSRCILDAYPAILISSSIKLQPSPPF
ncbi:Os02g0614550 [Oryza sativa Japonica Group]|uniref:Os02g0614550 protein n=1 Tax=Oryza sativa subsp. japonica TaxID=39947 RepID=C7IYW5_ORYSJ|nr:Os02g0614550 [Oryza sativa Japonica Group]|eukprot:NP_001173071.1 Os02g0614550 [Oryza sativa Japonica Group]